MAHDRWPWTRQCTNDEKSQTGLQVSYKPDHKRNIKETDFAVKTRPAPSQSAKINSETIKNLFKKYEIDISSVKKIGVTGGKSSDLDDSLDKIKIEKINEIDAIGLGAKKLYGIKDESTLVVSAGTGTACVHIQDKNFNW